MVNLTKPLQNRSIFYKKVKDDQDDEQEHNLKGDDDSGGDEEDNEEQEPPGSKRVKIDGRAGTYTESITVIDRYKARPKHLDDMCLAQFATSYVFASRVPKRVVFNEDGCSTENSNQKIFGNKVS